MGGPMRLLTWASKSPAKLADALEERGHDVCRNTVDKLLATKLEYSRQFNRKTHEGASHPDRNAQFEHVNAKVVAAQAKGEPVISVTIVRSQFRCPQRWKFPVFPKIAAHGELSIRTEHHVPDLIAPPT